MKPALLLALLIGCQDASDLQNDADKAQDKADAKIDEAHKDANQVALEAHQDASQISLDAQAAANKTIATAQDDFQSLRETYRHDRAVDLAKLDLEIDKVEAKAFSAKGAEKAEHEVRLKSIADARAAFVAGLETLSRATAATWDAERARVDVQWSNMQDAVAKG